MRTLVTLKRFDIDGRLAEIRQQYSRSFTKHFIEGLYLSHAQILTGAPLVVADVMGSTTRSVDCDSYEGQNPTAFPKVNLQVAGPSGRGTLWVPTGSAEYTSGTYLPVLTPSNRMPGHCFGIVVGRSATAPTPTDVCLGDRVHHGTGPTVSPAATIDSLSTGDTLDYACTTTNGLVGMLYMPLRSCLLSDIQFKVWRTGNPGNVNVIVAAVYQGAPATAASLPYVDATAIATSNTVNANLWGSASPGAFVTFTFASPPRLEAGFTYFIYIYPSQASAFNYVNMRRDATEGGRALACSANSTAAILSEIAGHTLYIADGTCGAEMEYGATDIYGLSISNPNGSFTMRRIFMNNSGEAITVQECGIYTPLSRYIAWASGDGAVNYNAFIVCAAHDTFAGIAVANAESLEVDYTPSITV